MEGGPVLLVSLDAVTTEGSRPCVGCKGGNLGSMGFGFWSEAEVGTPRSDLGAHYSFVDFLDNEP
jgi:hypothetical protein